MGFIYQIVNSINSQAYVGKTIFTIEERWKQHKQKARQYPNLAFKSKLYPAMKKYGVENFSISVLEECENERLNEQEKYWIKIKDSYYNGYNLTFGGDGYQTSNFEEVELLWNKGYSMVEIQNKLNLCQTTVSKCLDQIKISDQERRVRAHPGNKIVALDKITNNPYCYFNSYGEAARAVGLASPSSIYRIINNSSRSAGGYRWRDYDENIDENLFHGFKV